MAKKFGKFALLGTLIGAAAAGTYYCLKNKNKITDNEHEDVDDNDAFDADLENEDFSSSSVNSTNIKSFPHMPIDIDNAKEIIGEKVIETLDKTKEKIEQFNVAEKIDKAKEIIGGMTATSEPAYTEMDMSSTPADSSTAADTDIDTDTDNTDTSDMETKPESMTYAADEPIQTTVKIESVSSTYTNDSEAESSSEEFFNDSTAAK